MNITERIQQLLESELNAQNVIVEDDSWRHRGHAGAKEGGHYNVALTSAQFEGKSLVEQHALVYRALESVMPEIHALSIKSSVPAAGK